MTTSFTQIDLSRLPAPEVVEPLDYEAIRQAMIDDFRARDPEYDAILESDPAIKVLEAAAYREVLLRQRVNDAARARMLAFAGGSDLEHIGASFNVARQEGESDTRLRRRIQLVHETYTAAGTPGAYAWHAMSASTNVGDVTVNSPGPGKVEVSLIGADASARMTTDAMEAVKDRLHRDDVKALTDMVTVRAATLIPYTVRARLWLYTGPDARVIVREAERAVRDYAEATRRIGYDVTLSGLYAALHVGGVQEVMLRDPAETIEVDRRSCAVLNDIQIELAGRDE